MAPALTAERKEALLAELAEASASAAREAHARLMAAADQAAFDSAARTFQRMARNLRQTIGLHERVEKAAAERARGDDAAAAARRAEAVKARKARVSAALERQIRAEVDPDEVEDRLWELGERLDEEALYDSFTDEDVDAHIARLCADLGVEAAGVPPPACVKPPAGGPAPADVPADPSPPPERLIVGATFRADTS